MKPSLKIFEMLKTLHFFFKQKYILFLETFFKITKEYNSWLFFAEADTKKTLDMPRQKPQILHW